MSRQSAQEEDDKENSQESKETGHHENPEEEHETEEVDPFPLPTNQAYMSFYIHQNEWVPTKPLRPIVAMWGNPGPAIVNLPPTIGEEGHDFTKTKAPGYKIGIKHRRGGPSSDQGFGYGPGPGKYNTQGVTNMGKDRSKGPKIGKAPRFLDWNKNQGPNPGPAAYNRDQSDRAIYSHGPSFSMSKAKRDGGGGAGGGFGKAFITPAPNAYTMPTAFGPGNTPNLSKSPAFSIGKSRRDGFQSNPQSPGPAQYMLPSADVFLNKAPAFHMASKARPPLSGTSYTTAKPGPHAAHLVKYDKHSTPRITFGIRHSPYKVLPGFAAEK